jgi:hypothetical protein
MRVAIDEVISEVQFRLANSKSLREKVFLQTALENLQNYRKLLEATGMKNEPKMIQA